MARGGEYDEDFGGVALAVSFPADAHHPAVELALLCTRPVAIGERPRLQLARIRDFAKQSVLYDNNSEERPLLLLGCFNAPREGSSWFDKSLKIGSFSLRDCGAPPHARGGPVGTSPQDLNCIWASPHALERYRVTRAVHEDLRPHSDHALFVCDFGGAFATHAGVPPPVATDPGSEQTSTGFQLPASVQSKLGEFFEETHYVKRNVFSFRYVGIEPDHSRPVQTAMDALLAHVRRQRRHSAGDVPISPQIVDLHAAKALNRPELFQTLIEFLRESDVWLFNLGEIPFSDGQLAALLQVIQEPCPGRVTRITHGFLDDTLHRKKVDYEQMKVAVAQNRRFCTWWKLTRDRLGHNTLLLAKESDHAPAAVFNKSWNGHFLNLAHNKLMIKFLDGDPAGLEHEISQAKQRRDHKNSGRRRRECPSSHVIEMGEGLLLDLRETQAASAAASAARAAAPSPTGARCHKHQPNAPRRVCATPPP